MKFFLAAVVFVVLATTGSYALQCYNCLAANVDTCSTGNKTCTDPGEPRCGKVLGYTQDGSLYVLEACALKAECDHPDMLCTFMQKRFPGVVTCKFSCCSEDNCNGKGDFLA